MINIDRKAESCTNVKPKTSFTSDEDQLLSLYNEIMKENKEESIETLISEINKDEMKRAVSY